MNAGSFVIKTGRSKLRIQVALYLETAGVSCEPKFAGNSRRTGRIQVLSVSASAHGQGNVNPGEAVEKQMALSPYKRWVWGPSDEFKWQCNLGSAG